MPKRSSKATEMRSGSFSAPAMTKRKLPKSSGSQRRVSVEKGGSGEEHGCGVRANERADDAGIQRIGMEDDTDASGSRETQRAGKTKGMKEGENPENAVVGM